MITLDLQGKTFHHYPDQKRMIDRVFQLGIFTYLMNEQDHDRYNNQFPHSDQGVKHTYKLIEWRTDHVNKLKDELTKEPYESGKRLKEWEIEFRQWEVDLFEQIYLPITLALQEYRQKDTDCEYLTDDEYYQNGSNSWVKGKASSCYKLGLKEGDRFINGRYMQKYTFLSCYQSHYRSEHEWLNVGTVRAICETTRNRVSLKDYESYYKLAGTGDILNIAAPVHVEFKPPERILRNKHGQIQMF